MAIKILLDGTKISSLQKPRRKQTKLGFAAQCGISSRWLGYIEREVYPVSEAVAYRIARVLDVPLEVIMKHRVYPDSPEVDISDVGKHQKALDRAQAEDMAGKHGNAITICHRVLGRLGKGETVSRAVVTIRLATFLDNAGRQQQAIDYLQWNNQAWAADIPKRLKQWAAYHRAIAYRRLKQWDAAERELRSLLKDVRATHWAAAQHQLGVICLERSQGHEDSLTQALAYFEESRTCWQQEQNHREGFSLRRIAQVQALRKDYPDAIRCFMRAVEVFTRCKCYRYVAQTRQDLEEYVLGAVRFC